MSIEKYNFKFNEISCETWLQARRLCEKIEFYMKEAGRDPKVSKKGDQFKIQCDGSEYIFIPKPLNKHD